MTRVKGGTPNGQRNGQILKSITENRFPVPTRGQVVNFRKKLLKRSTQIFLQGNITRRLFYILISGNSSGKIIEERITTIKQEETTKNKLTIISLPLLNIIFWKRSTPIKAIAEA